MLFKSYFPFFDHHQYWQKRNCNTGWLLFLVFHFWFFKSSVCDFSTILFFVCKLTSFLLLFCLFLVSSLLSVPFFFISFCLPLHQIILLIFDFRIHPSFLRLILYMYLCTYVCMYVYMPIYLFQDGWYHIGKRSW